MFRPPRSESPSQLEDGSPTISPSSPRTNKSPNGNSEEVHQAHGEHGGSSASASGVGVPRPHPTHELSNTRKFGPDDHVVYHRDSIEADKAYRIRDLIRPPVIRQGKIHREPSPREVPRFELFFDLLFVAIIHQLADAAIEEPSGAAVARFVLTFWPSWSIWEEARKYSNVSGTDDLLHRGWILIGMICILGYSANASAIALEVAVGNEEEMGTEHLAVQAATAFWLVIKLTRVIVLFFYAWRLPPFRTSQILGGLAVLLPMFVYLPLIWVTNRTAQIVIASLGIAVDIMRLDLIAYNLMGRWHLRRQAKEWAKSQPVGPAEHRPGVKWHNMPSMPEGFRIPAMNIEHAIERSSAFVVIVLGELVMNLLYTATAADLGVSLKFGKAALGLMVAWAMNYLYLFPFEPNMEYEHALRHSWVTGVLFTFLHWPLCASLVLASAASGRMVASEEVDAGVHWYWGCGLGFAVLFITLIDLMHRNLAPTFATRIPRPFRASIALLCALALILVPLGTDSLTSIAMLAIGVGITWLLVVINIVGILPRPEGWWAAGKLKKRRERGGEGEENVTLSTY
ncbi:hypothetical protein EHS25_008882 [Saitozyma podzolica]|uniref:Uncharacterized protein n=1 Tax=Saitozyma podzolica TaxID=1890683 RepID=A0A427YN21_9TREE|nr:hypothetical protein EHS25_008882 [Saitozyma podzolica]